MTNSEQPATCRKKARNAARAAARKEKRRAAAIQKEEEEERVQMAAREAFENEQRARLDEIDRKLAATVRAHQQMAAVAAVRATPPDPSRTKYRVCKYIEADDECPFGADCRFAHSEEEKNAWEMQAQTEAPPRGVPPGPLLKPGRYKMCRYVEAGIFCRSKANCHFAHRPEELKLWNSYARIHST